MRNTVSHLYGLLFTALLVLCLPTCMQAQEKRSFWQHGLGKALVGFDKWLEKSQRKGIDTTYQDVPQLNRQVYLGSYSYWQNYQMNHPVYVSQTIRQACPGLEPWGNYRVNAYTLQSELELGVDWKGLVLELPIPIRNNYTLSLGLAMNGSVWGFRLRNKHLQNMDGYRRYDEMGPLVTSDAVLQHHLDKLSAETLNPQAHSINTFYGEAYYVPLHRRFSLSAGLYADMVQKRSAGSPLIYANYYQSRYTVSRILAADHDIYLTQQVSLGVGYGYNLAFLDGRLVFHASLVPMLSAYSRLIHESQYGSEPDPETGLTMRQFHNQYYPAGDKDFYEAADHSRSRFRVSIFARFAANYSFSRYLLTMLVNYRRYSYSNSNGLDIHNRESDVQVNLAYRF